MSQKSPFLIALIALLFYSCTTEDTPLEPISILEDQYFLRFRENKILKEYRIIELKESGSIYSDVEGDANRPGALELWGADIPVHATSINAILNDDASPEKFQLNLYTSEEIEVEKEYTIGPDTYMDFIFYKGNTLYGDHLAHDPEKYNWKILFSTINEDEISRLFSGTLQGTNGKIEITEGWFHVPLEEILVASE
ncbi:hypothetical protein RM553_04375 [Zunongwangia sp. F363]|uniref:Uncharacterized protein n=1 Tax=Autumnicola tepida TaxID=3075595 RepID=A0ABU3C6W7_9FLAO|nr:hypothetical protein [Zunongwangia sp. F363]MDT0642062.1 hypothetical protein [Zunongwangia sp. F363]